MGSETSTRHTTFVVEHRYKAAPGRVFAAWGDRRAKALWMGVPDESMDLYVLDFRIGGREFNRVGPEGGPYYTYEARFQDIVPDRRIIYSFDMHFGDARISVSLATVEFRTEGTGTLLVFTEQAAFLDGHEEPDGRKHGTKFAFRNLETQLEGAAE